MNTPNIHIDPELLSAYLDEEVTANERQLIETHLPTCAACQQELASLRFTVAMVQALPTRPIPRTFYVTEAMVTPEPKASSAGWMGWLRGLAPFGAALAALFVVFVVARPLMFGGSGAAVPAAAPVEAPAMAVMTTEVMEESGGAAESAAPEGETRNGDTAAQATALPETADTQAVMEPPADGTMESAPIAGNTSSDTFSITAPIVGTGGETLTDSTDTSVDDAAVPSTEAVPTTKANDEDLDSQVTPAAMNTILIFTVILVVVAVGTLVIFARRRQ